MRSLASINKYFLQHKWRLLIGMLFVVLSNIFGILPPVVTRKIVDNVAENVSKYHLIAHTPLNSIIKGEVISNVMWGGMIILLLALMQGVFMYYMRQTIIVMSRHIEYAQKNDIYRHYQLLDATFYKQHSTGDLMNRISEDVGRVRMYTGPAIMYITNLVALIVLAIYNMIMVSPMLTLYSVIPLPILAFVIYYVNNIVNKKSKIIQRELSDITTFAQQSYSGIRVIKSFNDESANTERFSSLSGRYKSSNIDLGKVESIYFPAMNLFIGISVLITVLIGGYYYMNGMISVGNIIEFIMYILKMTFPISAIGWTANMVTRAAVSQQRINEFLRARPVVVDNGTVDKEEEKLKGNISLRDVRFEYPHTGIKAIKGINLDIKAGEKVCILGATGSGKTTLALLMSRLYDVQSGTIMIDNVPIQDYKLSYLRDNISIVPQETILFSDSIYNNIAFGNMNAQPEEIYNAARMASIHDEILDLEKGYDTIVGERGVMLSGGQKQRIAIARALIQLQNIIILDASLSAVDTNTEEKIQHQLRDTLREKTVIIITHRIFKHWDFDRIIVLDDGIIKEQGTHEALINAKGNYYDLYQYQTSIE